VQPLAGPRLVRNLMFDVRCLMFDGWVVGWLDGWMIGWLDDWMVGWLDGWMVGWWMVGWLDGGWLDGWMVARAFTILVLAVPGSCYSASTRMRCKKVLSSQPRILSAQISSIPFNWSAFLDRKSTRLNSSHQIISYAVFCLKKKKI